MLHILKKWRDEHPFVNYFEVHSASYPSIRSLHMCLEIEQLAKLDVMLLVYAQLAGSCRPKPSNKYRILS